MNILFINDFAPTFPGSFFKSLYAFSQKLNEHGYNIYYIFPEERDYITRLEQFGKVFYCPSFMGKKLDIGLIKLVYTICKEKNIDIVHTNFGFAAQFTATILSKILNFHHFAHERSLSNNYFKKDTNIIKKYRAKLLFGFLQMISNQTKYIAISNGVKESLINYNGISAKNIKVIPNAVSINTLSRNEEENNITYLKKMKMTNNYFVGMVAHFGPQKDHKTLIDAAELVINKKPNTFFVLIGGNLVNDRDDFRSQIKKIINTKKLDKHFIFLGEVQNPIPYVELFDVGCLISNWEGFGNALVEYMLKKKPVIGTAVGGIKDIIEDGINGYLIPQKRADILAEKIIYLLENPDIAQNMGEKGYKKAVTNYNMETWVSKIIQLYESIL